MQLVTQYSLSDLILLDHHRSQESVRFPSWLAFTFGLAQPHHENHLQSFYINSTSNGFKRIHPSIIGAKILPVEFSQRRRSSRTRQGEWSSSCHSCSRSSSRGDEDDTSTTSHKSYFQYHPTTHPTITTHRPTHPSMSHVPINPTINPHTQWSSQLSI